ncbi:hypothetical protein J437_LFUL011828 [Ladona fulva]|uniref:Ig-like domain-containing protein n=1 Tax=Ladona fulva TaxID=123851 RepID=A0A8K0K9S2_LADFU|nr:hypothetical protein J437_LFUL011828 [Ladona fulva]
MPNEVNVCLGEGVRIRATGVTGDLRKCGVYSPSGRYFNLLPAKNLITKQQGPEPVYWDSEIEGERCGFRIDEITMTERGAWKLEVELSTNKTENTTAKIYPFDCGQNLDHEYIFNAGQKIAYTVCGDSESIRCLLRKPERYGEDTTGSPPAERGTGCSLTGIYDSRDAGVWTCDWATEKSIKKRSSKMTMMQKPLITTETKELSEEVAMLCKYDGPVSIFQACRWVKPGGEELYPQDGLVLGRYAYYGAGLFRGECGLSIRKPIEEGDKGVWRCELFENKKMQPSSGAYVELGIPKRTREQKLSTLRKWAGAWKKGGEEVALAVVGQSLTIGCSLYTPLSFCQIIHPNGSRIEPMGDLVKSYGSGNGLGDCGITFNSVSAHDAGIWKCIIGVEYGEAVTSLIDVKVYGSELEAVNLDRSSGGGVVIRCVTVFGEALEHCRIQRPDGSIFDSEIGYQTVGNFSDGVCSVTLPSVRSSDVGVWRCIGRIAGQSREITAKFTLRSTGK